LVDVCCCAVARSVVLGVSFEKNKDMDEELLSRYKWAIEGGLTEEDDIDLWVNVLETLLPEIELLKPENYKKPALYLQVGACSHWYRPHQTRWTADGGFAYPSGYGGGHSVGWSGLPEHEWFILFHWDEEKNRWKLIKPKFVDKRKLVCRVSIPTRTARHNQAAVHVFWSPGSPKEPDKKLTLLYGFRKKDGKWQCVASHSFPEPAKN
jgi:hypothetical protein